MNYFLKKFQGKYLEFVINMQMTEELESGDTRVGPLVLKAFVVDVDDRFVYLGDNNLEIDSAVKIDDIRFVSIVDMSIFDDEILDPERSEDLN